MRLPHVGQKWRVLMLPLSALEAYEAVWPLMSMSSFLNRASDICPVPDARWQSLQWHWPMPSGCALIEKVTAPHRQRPVIRMFGIYGTPKCLDMVEGAGG